MEACAITLPRKLNHLPLRPRELPAWSRLNVSVLHHTSPYGFTPSNNDSHKSRDGWKTQITASQNPENCRRFLLVEDDLAFQGLGFTSQFWVSALLVAVRTGRVLLEVPVNGSWPPPPSKHPNGSRAITGFNQTRWCGLPPYTLQCFFTEWTYCQAPQDVSLHHAPTTRHLRRDGDPKYSQLRSLPEEPDIIRMKLSWIKVSPLGWVRGNAYHAAIRFLTNPRPWIRRIGECVMHTNGLARHKFISVFIRDSAEKRAELAAHGHGMPHQGHYERLTQYLATLLGWQHVHLQTSSDHSLNSFNAFARRVNLTVAVTNNERSTHDTWGGWTGRAETLQTAAAIVNQYIASQAGIFVSLSSSAWTNFIMHIMHGKGSDSLRPAPRLLVLCCGCKGRDLYGRPITNRSTNVEVAAAREVYDSAANALQQSTSRGSASDLTLFVEEHELLQPACKAFACHDLEQC